MARFVFACLLIGSWCHAAIAAESAPSANAPRYVAKVKFLRVEGGKQIIAVDTEVTGTKGTPLKANLGGKRWVGSQTRHAGRAGRRTILRTLPISSWSRPRTARRSCCPQPIAHDHR